MREVVKPGGRAPNRLGRESSPYLRQHMYNPVDWYPWGDEALRRAREEDKPILLSVGYAACHWCHVMERECFEDEAIAAQMSRDFVCVKVDREERPDVDNLYQLAVQLSRRSGGWPLTAVLTPAGEPFFVGTYFPPTARHGLPGFPDVLTAARAAWDERRGEVDESARRVTAALARARDTRPGAEIGSVETLVAAAEFLLEKVDPEHGGLGGAPKFPSPTNLWTLWRHGSREGGREARDAVVFTLRKMADGGVYDQLGGGFHRYATDREWLVPHFEKMLYDNAQLACLYLEAWRERAHGASATEAGAPAEATELLRVATETLDYLAREMRSPEGLFHAATDADSEGVEGRYFVWTPPAVRAALDGEPDAERLARRFGAFYGVTSLGNWEGVTILRRHATVPEAAAAAGLAPEELDADLARARARLLTARAARVPPLLDDKCLVAWNSLTIVAFVEGARATGRADWADIARTAADAILRLLVSDGRLQHSWCRGDVKGPAYLDDLAGFGLALLRVYELLGDPRHLDAALALAMTLEAHHGDSAGGWYQTADDAERLVQRPRDSHDGAVPCGAGLAAAFFVRLAAHTGEGRWQERAEATLRAHAGLVEGNPYAAGTLLGVLDTVLHGFEEVVLTGEGPERAAMERAAGELPGVDRLVLDLQRLPEGHPAAGGRTATAPTAWVCRGRTCSLPVRTAGGLRALLGAPADR